LGCGGEVPVLVCRGYCFLRARGGPASDLDRHEPLVGRQEQPDKRHQQRAVNRHVARAGIIVAGRQLGHQGDGGYVQEVAHADHEQKGQGIEELRPFSILEKDHQIEYICDRVAILKEGELIVCSAMEAMRASLGRREYELIFKSDEEMGQEQQDGNSVFRSNDVAEIAAMLNSISENRWALVNLSVRESALEEIYVKVLTA